MPAQIGIRKPEKVRKLMRDHFFRQRCGSEHDAIALPGMGADATGGQHQCLSWKAQAMRPEIDHVTVYGRISRGIEGLDADVLKRHRHREAR